MVGMRLRPRYFNTNKTGLRLSLSFFSGLVTLSFMHQTYRVNECGYFVVCTWVTSNLQNDITVTFDHVQVYQALSLLTYCHRAGGTLGTRRRGNCDHPKLTASVRPHCLNPQQLIDYIALYMGSQWWSQSQGQTWFLFFGPSQSWAALSEWLAARFSR